MDWKSHCNATHKLEKWRTEKNNMSSALLKLVPAAERSATLTFLQSCRKTTNHSGNHMNFFPDRYDGYDSYGEYSDDSYGGYGGYGGIYGRNPYSRSTTETDYKKLVTCVKSEWEHIRAISAGAEPINREDLSGSFAKMAFWICQCVCSTDNAWLYSSWVAEINTLLVCMVIHPEYPQDVRTTVKTKLFSARPSSSICRVVEYFHDNALSWLYDSTKEVPRSIHSEIFKLLFRAKWEDAKIEVLLNIMHAGKLFIQGDSEHRETLQKFFDRLFRERMYEKENAIIISNTCDTDNNGHGHGMLYLPLMHDLKSLLGSMPFNHLQVDGLLKGSGEWPTSDSMYKLIDKALTYKLTKTMAERAGLSASRNLQILYRCRAIVFALEPARAPHSTFSINMFTRVTNDSRSESSGTGYIWPRFHKALSPVTTKELTLESEVSDDFARKLDEEPSQGSFSLDNGVPTPLYHNLCSIWGMAHSEWTDANTCSFFLRLALYHPHFESPGLVKLRFTPTANAFTSTPIASGKYIEFLTRAKTAFISSSVFCQDSGLRAPPSPRYSSTVYPLSMINLSLILQLVKRSENCPNVANSKAVALFLQRDSDSYLDLACHVFSGLILNDFEIINHQMAGAPNRKMTSLLSAADQCGATLTHVLKILPHRIKEHMGQLKTSMQIARRGCNPTPVYHDPAALGIYPQTDLVMEPHPSALPPITACSWVLASSCSPDPMDFLHTLRMAWKGFLSQFFMTLDASSQSQNPFGASYTGNLDAIGVQDNLNEYGRGYQATLFCFLNNIDDRNDSRTVIGPNGVLTAANSVFKHDAYGWIKRLYAARHIGHLPESEQKEAWHYVRAFHILWGMKRSLDMKVKLTTYGNGSASSAEAEGKKAASKRQSSARNLSRYRHQILTSGCTTFTTSSELVITNVHGDDWPECDKIDGTFVDGFNFVFDRIAFASCRVAKEKGYYNKKCALGVDDFRIAFILCSFERVIDYHNKTKTPSVATEILQAASTLTTQDIKSGAVCFKHYYVDQLKEASDVEYQLYFFVVTYFAKLICTVYEDFAKTSPEVVSAMSHLLSTSPIEELPSIIPQSVLMKVAYSGDVNILFNLRERARKEPQDSTLLSKTYEEIRKKLGTAISKSLIALKPVTVENGAPQIFVNRTTHRQYVSICVILGRLDLAHKTLCKFYPALETGKAVLDGDLLNRMLRYCVDGTEALGLLQTYADSVGKFFCDNAKEAKIMVQRVCEKAGVDLAAPSTWEQQHAEQKDFICLLRAYESLTIDSLAMLFDEAGEKAFGLTADVQARRKERLRLYMADAIQADSLVISDIDRLQIVAMYMGRSKLVIFVERKIDELLKETNLSQETINFVCWVAEFASNGPTLTDMQVNRSLLMGLFCTWIIRTRQPLPPSVLIALQRLSLVDPNALCGSSGYPYKLVPIEKCLQYLNFLSDPADEVLLVDLGKHYAVDDLKNVGNNRSEEDGDGERARVHILHLAWSTYCASLADQKGGFIRILTLVRLLVASKRHHVLLALMTEAHRLCAMTSELVAVLLSALANVRYYCPTNGDVVIVANTLRCDGSHLNNLRLLCESSPTEKELLELGPKLQKEFQSTGGIQNFSMATVYPGLLTRYLIQLFRS
jgi:hypothetical protein